MSRATHLIPHMHLRHVGKATLPRRENVCCLNLLHILCSITTQNKVTMNIKISFRQMIPQRKTAIFSYVTQLVTLVKAAVTKQIKISISTRIR